MEAELNTCHPNALKHLAEILATLNIQRNYNSIDDLFEKIVATVIASKDKCHKAGLETTPALPVPMISENQWAKLKELNNDFQLDYEIRRRMLLQRLDVTIQSFKWTDRLSDKTALIDGIFQAHRRQFSRKPEVELSDVLAARSDVTVVGKMSSASDRRNTKSTINKITIGRVPDRGGRPNETQAPPPEMPSWQKRQPGSAGWAPRGGDRGSRSYRGEATRGNENRGRRGGNWEHDSGSRSQTMDRGGQHNYQVYHSNYDGWGDANSYSGGRGGREHGATYSDDRGGHVGYAGSSQGGNYSSGRGDHNFVSGGQNQGSRGNRGRGRGGRVQGGWQGH